MTNLKTNHPRGIRKGMIDLIMAGPGMTECVINAEPEPPEPLVFFEDHRSAQHRGAKRFIR